VVVNEAGLAVTTVYAGEPVEEAGPDDPPDHWPPANWSVLQGSPKPSAAVSGAPAVLPVNEAEMETWYADATIVSPAEGVYTQLAE
jgi:hypothetical protein